MQPILIATRCKARPRSSYRARTAGEVDPTAGYSHEPPERVRCHQRCGHEGRYPAPRAPPHPLVRALGRDEHAHQGPQQRAHEQRRPRIAPRRNWRGYRPSPAYVLRCQRQAHQRRSRPTPTRSPPSPPPEARRSSEDTRFEVECLGDRRTRTGSRSADGGVSGIGAPKRSRAPRGSGGLWRNLAYHRRARLEAKLGEALDEVDRQIQDLRAYRG
jgi:hypothetical protein